MAKKIKEIVPSYSFLLTVGQGSFEKIVGSGAKRTSFEDVPDRDSLNALQEFVLVPGFPRRVAVEHLVADDPQGPDVALRRVLHSLKNLRSHIDRATHTRLKHLRPKVVNVLCEAKVTDLVNTFIDQYVGWFKVSMDNLLADELGEATKYLTHDFKYFIFFELLAFHEFL